MGTPLQVLILEDRPDDAELMVHELRQAGFDPQWQRVETEADLLAHLDPGLEIILSDFTMPQFNAPRALELLQQSGLDIPFIIVSGSVGEHQAVLAMKKGATDFLLKDRLGRLGHAVLHALEERRLRREKQEAEHARQQAAEALQRSEALLSQLFEYAPDGILAVNLEGRIVRVNRQAEQLFGYQRAEILNQFIEVLLPERFREKHVPQRSAYMANPHLRPMGLCLELQARRKDASEFPVDVTLGPVRTNGTSLVLATVRDITERQRAEQALRAKDEEVREVSQQLWQTAKLATMGELAASIAHELNNPLATVGLHVESLLTQLQEDEAKAGALRVVEQEVERMAKLVANLLQFSRPGLQQISTIDVRQEIDKTLELVYFYLSKRSIQVVREFAADLPMIQADRQQLRQVFINLLVNACDAMPQGGTITLRAARGVGSGGEKTIVLEFADTGVGIAPEILPRVTESFFTTKPEGKGTGLGLAICRRIVQEHRGTIEIASELGTGTTVRVTLPVVNGENGKALAAE